MAATTTIRVPVDTHARLQQLAEKRARPIGQLIDELLDDHEEQRFFAQYAADTARLRADPDAWQDYQSELALWDTTLRDGLADDE